MMMSSRGQLMSSVIGPAAVLKLAVAVLALLSLAACGSKAPLTPPAGMRPPALKAVTARGQDGRLVMEWTTPEAGDAGLQVAGFRVYRRQWKAGATDPAQARTLLMADIQAPAGGPGEKSVFVDDGLKSGDTYEYHLFTYNSAKTLGTDYKIGPFTADFPTGPVTGFDLQAGDGCVIVRWQSAEPLRIFIYRAEGKEGPYGLSPVNPQPESGGLYRDYGVQDGTLYRYKARPALAGAGVVLEGPFGEERVVKARDQSPPPEPLVMWIKTIKGGVRLRWQPVNDPGLLGYYVERRRKDDGADKFEKVSGLLTVDEFTDRSLGDPGDYVYRVAARDRAGNLSFSVEHKLRYPLEEKPGAEEGAAPPDSAETAPGGEGGDADPEGGGGGHKR